MTWNNALGFLFLGAHTFTFAPKIRSSNNDTTSPSGAFLGSELLAGINGPFGKMVSLEAAISSIIASKSAFYLEPKWALMWGFLWEAFQCFYSYSFPVGRQVGDNFAVFSQNLKQGYLRSCEGTGPQWVLRPWRVRSPPLQGLWCFCLHAQLSTKLQVRPRSFWRNQKHPDILTPSRPNGLLQFYTLFFFVACPWKGGTLFICWIQPTPNESPKVPELLMKLSILLQTSHLSFLLLDRPLWIFLFHKRRI